MPEFAGYCTLCRRPLPSTGHGSSPSRGIVGNYVVTAGSHIRLIDAPRGMSGPRSSPEAVTGFPIAQCRDRTSKTLMGSEVIVRCPKTGGPASFGEAGAAVTMVMPLRNVAHLSSNSPIVLNAAATSATRVSFAPMSQAATLRPGTEMGRGFSVVHAVVCGAAFS